MTVFKGQHYLLGDEAPAQQHSPTSVAAAKAQTTDEKITQRQQILDLLRDRGAMTDEAIGLALHMDLNAVRPRRVKLVADGLVRQAGEGRTTSGHRAATWGRSQQGGDAMQVFGGQGFIDFDSPPLEVTKEAQDAACETAGRKARKHMESLAELQKVLRRLRTGLPLEKMEYDCDGGRVAALVHILRKSYGFTVGGHGTVSDPYVMKDTRQTPSLAGVTEEMKETYYCLPHWHSKRQERFDMDGNACVLCRDTDELQCHHVTYRRLFREELSDLMTVCRYHHEVIHASCKLKFPCGISSEFAYQIGWKGPDAWLLP